jgi:hypothetical protein
MKTTYKVTAATGFRGHKLGDEFDADLTPDQEKRAKDRGSIRVVSRHEPKPKSKGDTDDA